MKEGYASNLISKILYLDFYSFNNILIYLYLSNLFPGSWIYKRDATEAS